MDSQEEKCKQVSASAHLPCCNEDGGLSGKCIKFEYLPCKREEQMAHHTMIMKITQVNGPAKGFFLAEEDGKEAGRMTYSWAGGDKFIIDHTEVDPAFKGRNVGKSMVEEAVLFARKSGAKILPLCPFAKSVFEKREDLRDVLI